MSFERIAIIGLGLLGGSIGLAVRQHISSAATTGYDLDPATRRRAGERGLTDTVCETAAEAVRAADLVIFCVPPGRAIATSRATSNKLIATSGLRAPTAVAPSVGCGALGPKSGLRFLNACRRRTTRRGR